jgi:hypothetical protein
MVNQDELKIRDYKRYRSFYCGLCRALEKRCGISGKLTLTYDMTFADILLNAYTELPLKSERHRCMVHPVRKQDMLFNEITDYCADMTLLLTYYKMLDDVNDDGSMTGRVFVMKEKKKFEKTAALYPRQAKVFEDSMRALAQTEERREYDLDKVAGYTGNMLAELLVYEESVWSDELRRLGFYLGKFIYLLDAFEDLEKDLKKGAYNPWQPSKDRKDFEALVENTLMMMISECAKSFERLPIIQDVDILRNIIYSGVWQKYEEVREKRDKKREGQE